MLEVLSRKSEVTVFYSGQVRIEQVDPAAHLESLTHIANENYSFYFRLASDGK